MTQQRAMRNIHLALILWALMSLNLLAQVSSLMGVVSDSQGAALSGATVTVSDPARAITLSTMTAKDGQYLIPQLAPGSYKVKISAKGFSSIEAEIAVEVDKRTVLDVAMKVGSVDESVTIQGGEAALNTADATIGNNFNEKQIKLLPLLANNVINLLSLQTGAVFVQGNLDGVDQRNGSISGARSDQTNVTLDGVDVNDPQNSTAYFNGLRMTSEALQEFRVTTTNYTASQGRSSAAQVSLVTKSGSNEIHGAAYWSHRNTATSVRRSSREFRSGGESQWT